MEGVERNRNIEEAEDLSFDDTATFYPTYKEWRVVGGMETIPSLICPASARLFLSYL